MLQAFKINDFGFVTDMSDDSASRFTVGAIGGVPVGVLSIRDEPAEWPAEFTDAERDVAGELFRGSSYQDIADQRGTSLSTVASQARAVFEKAGVDSVSELVAKFASE